MSNFDLKIILARDHIAIIAESNFGETSIQIQKEFIDEAIQESENLRQEYTWLINKNPQAREKVESKVSDFGSKLFRGIFKDEILTLFNRTIGGAEKSQIDIRLLLSEPNFNSVHWEVMRFRDEYIGFRHNLFRHPFVARPISIPSEKREKLNVLLVSVDPIYPRNYYEVLRDEHFQISNLLKKFGDQIHLIELQQEKATIENIKEALFQGVDIFHFSGHGYVDKENPMDSSLIVYPDESSLVEKSASAPKHQYGAISIRFLTTLAVNQNLGFSFLNACNTGRNLESSNQDIKVSQEASKQFNNNIFVNMAYNLIQAGVPVVIATNHEITYEAGYLLTKRFYTSVLKYGKRIDQALRDVRAELYIDAFSNNYVSFGDWSCPVLYSRSRNLNFGTASLVPDATLDIYDLRNIQKPVEVALAREESLLDVS